VRGSRFRPGGLVGHYRIERPLGAGASGRVFAARARGGEEVAVKALHPDRTDDDVLRERFRREAGLARAIESPYVVPILEAGELDGVAYLVMPLYAETLAQRLRHGPLGLDETVHLAAQLGKGLDLLHAHEILHRDVKPSNVLIGRDGIAALADFGLARGAASTTLTEDGQLLGTPHYLAPELIGGQEASPTSDVYALGCVLYECLVGAPPFAGRSLAELGFAHLVERPPDPSELRPQLSADVGAAVLTALEKDPADRPPTGTALSRLLHVARRAARA
jgi:serine/threonine protein kinase